MKIFIIEKIMQKKHQLLNLLFIFKTIISNENLISYIFLNCLF